MDTDYDQNVYVPPHQVTIPPPKPLLTAMKSSLKETLFSDDPLRRFQNQSASKKAILGLQYVFSILEWLPRYKLGYLKSDVIAGVTISSLAVPQGISYAALANLPPIIGIYMSFVPPLVYAVLGTSRHIAIGPVAVSLVLLASIVAEEVSPKANPKLYLQMCLTSTLFAGIFQASLGFLRLGFVVDFLSQATIMGFMAGTAITVITTQLLSLLGIANTSGGSDVVSLLTAIFTQFQKWQWEPAAMGCALLFLLFLSRNLLAAVMIVYFVGYDYEQSMKRPSLFWISALAPLCCVIVGSLLVFLTPVEKHNIKAIGHLPKGLNPVTVSDLSTVLKSRHLPTSIKAGIISGIIGLAEGIAGGRSIASIENYHVDGNKEMIAFGMMNIIGSCTCCPLASAIFSRTAVNYGAGGKTMVSPIVMAIIMLLTLLFLTPVFEYTPIVALSSIIIVAMYSVVDIPGTINLWKIDKIDFMVCLGACLGCSFGNVQIGLFIAVAISLLRLILFITRPRTLNLGNIPNTSVYRSIDQYPDATSVPGILILLIDSPIYYANANYLRERIPRWVYEEEDRINACGGTNLQYIILDLSNVGGIDASGISMLQEVKKNLERQHLKLVLANPRSEVVKKLDVSKFIEKLGQEWMFLTVDDAVKACKVHSRVPNPAEDSEC